MSGNFKKEYKANYRVPPEASRWHKGQSGNPSGRPKERPPETDTGKILQSFGNEMVEATVGGKSRLMRSGEYRIQKLFTMAIDGNLAAGEQIENMAAHHLQPEEKGAAGYQFVVMPDYYFHRAHREMSASECRDVKRRLKKIQSKQSEPEVISSAYMFRNIALEPVRIEIDGKKTNVTLWQLYLRKIWMLTLSGNMRASRLQFKLEKQYPGDAPSGPLTTYLITKEDEDL